MKAGFKRGVGVFLAGWLLLLCGCAGLGEGEPPQQAGQASQPSSSPEELQGDGDSPIDEPDAEDTSGQEEPLESPGNDDAVTQENSLVMGQEDPTLTDNHLFFWDHIEYSCFGDPADYRRVEFELTEVVKMEAGGNLGKGRMEASILLPPICSRSYSIIDVDVGFAGGGIKMGEWSVYYQLQPGETAYDNAHMETETYGWDAWGQEELALVETRDNVLGGYWQGDRYRRYIAELFGNALVRYVVELPEGYITPLYFYVSQSATAEDLALYDAIVESIQVHEVY